LKPNIVEPHDLKPNIIEQKYSLLLKNTLSLHSSKTTADLHLLLPKPNIVYQDVAIEEGWCSRRLHGYTT